MVSVIVATYRRETALSKALESLAIQTYPNFEIVLVDDNDQLQWNEKVRTVVDKFVSTHERIPFRYIKNHPNQGSAKARNIGIHAAAGQYITFLDDDDIYLPDKIQRQVSYMQANDCDYCITDLNLFNEKDHLVDRRVRSYIQDTSQEALQYYHLMYHMTGTDTMMFRKSYLMQIGCFAPVDVGDEYYLMQRAIEGGGRFGYLPGSDIKAYVHTGDGGLSSGEGKIKGENALFAYKKKYFSHLPLRDRRCIKMRHYAVLAFACLRVKNYWRFFTNGICSFCSAPIKCILLLLGKTG